MIRHSLIDRFAFACRFCGTTGEPRPTQPQAAADYAAHLDTCTKHPANRGATP